MLYTSDKFNAMRSGLDALWLRQKVVSNNIANYETPNYKAKEVVFERKLREEKGKLKPKYTVAINEDNTSQIRMDGNNVSMDKETLELWRTYSNYSYLTQKISGEFKNTRYVINQTTR